MLRTVRCCADSNVWYHNHVAIDSIHAEVLRGHWKSGADRKVSESDILTSGELCTPSY